MDIIRKNNLQTNPNPGNNGLHADLNFNVMPKSDPDHSLTGGIQTDQTARDFPEIPRPVHSRTWLKRLLIISGIVAAGAAGFLIYAFLTRTDSHQTPNSSTGLMTEDMENIKHTPADSDVDGLPDDDEEMHGTRVDDNDTDGDGLSDGDEINIYGSNPLLADTDNDTFDDGREVARAYSPLENSPDRAPQLQIEIWNDRIEKHGLHEPTLTTLKLKLESSQSENVMIYTNSKFGYSLAIPVSLMTRESDDVSQVGIYVAGTDPIDEISTDPITVSTAVIVQTQTLADWIRSQYSDSDYDSMKTEKINGEDNILLSGIIGENCKQDKVFYKNRSTVIILTLSCSENQVFSDLYKQITGSMKFETVQQ